MFLRRIGVLVAVIVFLFALARISSIVVDWAWFSSIGYVGVFWTVFATKAALFVVVFAVSTLLLWANATLALRFTSRRPLRLPVAFDPGFATFQASPGLWAGSYGLRPSPFVWRLLTVAVAVILGLLIAWGETGGWDLILRFIHQTSYSRNDPLFDKDIGFYLFSLPVYVAVKNLLLWILLLAALMAGSIYFLHDDISLDPPAWSVSPSQSPMAPRCSASISRLRPGPMCWIATSCSTTTTALLSAPAIPTFMSSCPRSGCS
jgi:uncharacterized membrane protein (UPF0182 family)